MRLAICTPSRGLIHSRTVQAVQIALALAPAAVRCCLWALSHDLPVPDAHEELAERAMDAGAEAILFIEDDMIPPPEAISALLSVDADIVALDYPLRNGTPDAQAHQRCAQLDKDGSVLWCGLGCTLIHRRVFQALPKPWFGRNTEWLCVGGDPANLRQTGNTAVYASTDVNLCMAARAAGFQIALVPGSYAGHADVVAMGRRNVSHGIHEVKIYEVGE